MIAGATKLALKALQKANRNPDFAQRFRFSWLDRLTASGSDPAPPPLPLKALADEAFVHGSPEYPILWIPVADHALRTLSERSRVYRSRGPEDDQAAGATE